MPILRMVTAPPIAQDRLIGLANISSNLVKSMEIQNRIPPRMDSGQINTQLQKIGQVIETLIDIELFPWLQTRTQPTDEEVYRSATVVADRLCNAMTNPIIRNTQEQRQLETIRNWLEKRNYTYIEENRGLTIRTMKPGTFAFRFNVSVTQPGRTKATNLPIDVVVAPKQKRSSNYPLLIEAKSAGDFTNTNKRRKEEATKIAQLRATYGEQLELVLFLCGYFDSGYLGYEAAEGLDWVWEHRIDDLAEFGI